MRLIRLPWLTLVSEGEETAVSPDWFGTVRSAVVAGGETAVVSTSSLKWFCDGADGPQLAVVTAPRGASLTDRKGTAVQRYLPIPWGRVLCVLRMDEERVYVCWRGVFGYLKRPEVEPEGMPDGSFPSALVLPEGGSGEAAVRSSMEPGGSGMAAAEWPAGTEVVILDRADGYCLAEGLGCRGWIPEGNLAAAEAGE